MNMDNVLDRATSVALRVVKHQRNDLLTKAHLMDELVSLLQEIRKQSKADRVALKARERSFAKLTSPPGKVVGGDGKLYRR